MLDFENSLIRGIRKSWYIASWYMMGGSKIESVYYSANRPNEKNFVNWLKTLVIDGEHLTEEEIYSICTLARVGSRGLLYSAMKYLNGDTQSKES